MKSDEFLKGLSFLDVQRGLNYCGGSPEFYGEMILAFLENDALEDLKKAYKEKNLEAYHITVHSLKSSSMMVGAAVFSEECRCLEHAAKDGDWAYLRENHERVLSQYETLLKDCGEAMERAREAGLLEGFDLDAQEGPEPGPDLLLVDDDPINQMLARHILMEQWKIDCVSSGAEAISYLEKKLPRLLLLDLHMPDMNGFTLLQYLRQQETLKDLPVVFLTADQDADAEVEGFRMGAMDFIRKPFIREIMVRRVSRILELQQLQDHLEQEVERQTKKALVRKQRLERVIQQVIQALAGTVDAKDRYTNGHSMRVAEYSRELSRRMGMTPAFQENIYYTGLLHDIGKIGVPDEIINKPGRLTEREFEIIKTHPVIGSEILKSITEIPGLYVGTRGHHERYDGRGYPDGLAGEEIPLQARIIAVADSYDAMTSTRSYRSLLPQQVVRQEIEKGKGSQFDPAIADLMLQMIDEDREYHMHE